MLPQVFPVTCHTDYVGQGSTFVVINGMSQDGSVYIQEALRKGAKKIVLHQSVELSEFLLELISQAGAQIERVIDTRKALAILSAQAAEFPAQKLKILGITGTKGKTTTAHMLYNLLLAAGHKVALINTVENKIGPDITLSAPLTTPQPDYLHQFFKLCIERAVEYVVMEVAAQALTFNRIETLAFDALIFTNLDREHGELYPTMQEYFQTKCKLFNYAKPSAPILVNADDQYGQKILATHVGDQQYKSYGKKTGYTYCAFFYEQALEIDTDYFMYKNFPGEFNSYNLLAALAVCYELGIDKQLLKKGVMDLPTLRGRLEEYRLPNGARAFIDYAHTPASFKGLFATVRPWTNHLIVVFGAGGGKDHTKRPLMGQYAAEFADLVILTADNPRHETLETIIDDIKVGIALKYKDKVIVQVDRKKAIEKAYECSVKTSIILILGKGPDEYQIIGNEKILFQERVILKNL
jgi:UDP-N-acetylmuramoyl-L-alanyl-D-glutamate--2,6-diaminopimelate ligase